MTSLPERAAVLGGVESGHAVADGHERGQQHGQHQKQEQEV